MKATFKVQHEILAGLKYLQKVSKGPLSNKMQEMMVSCFALRVGLRGERPDAANYPADGCYREATGPTPRTSLCTRRSVRHHSCSAAEGAR